MTEKSKALANPAALLKKQIAEQNQRIAQSDSSRIGVSIKGFKAPGSEEEGDEILCVVVDYTLVNSFWPGAYDPDNIVDPDCYANNRVWSDLAPVEESPDKQAETCAVCPQNAWGSAPTGKGKACKNMRLLAILPLDAIDKAPVWTISVSPTGTKRWDAYIRDLAKNNLTPLFVATNISLVPKIDYASLVFEMDRVLTAEETNAAISRLTDAQGLLDRIPIWEDRKEKDKKKKK